MRFSSVAGISIALVLSIAIVIVVGELLWTIPNETGRVLRARAATCESLAAQVAFLVTQKDVAAIQSSLRDVVESNPDVQSAALRRSDGTLLAVQGDHERNWTPPPGDTSTPTNVQVPVYDGNTRWGAVEVRFTPVSSQWLPALSSGWPGDT